MSEARGFTATFGKFTKHTMAVKARILSVAYNNSNFMGSHSSMIKLGLNPGFTLLGEYPLGLHTTLVLPIM